MAVLSNTFKTTVEKVNPFLIVFSCWSHFFLCLPVTSCVFFFLFSRASCQVQEDLSDSNLCPMFTSKRAAEMVANFIRIHSSDCMLSDPFCSFKYETRIIQHLLLHLELYLLASPFEHQLSVIAHRASRINHQSTINPDIAICKGYK